MLKFLFVFLITPMAFAATHTVEMKSISYEPKVLKIKTGDTVQWTNVSYTEHSATSDDANDKSEPKFETGMIARKKTSKKIEFKSPGTFAYHCSVHGKTMSAKIEVQP